MERLVECNGVKFVCIYIYSIPMDCTFLCIKVFPQEKGQDVSHSATKNMEFHFCVIMK